MRARPARGTGHPALARDHRPLRAHPQRRSRSCPSTLSCIPAAAQPACASPTPFIGREDELAEIEACLREPDCRLLTVVGSGGIGKTRLALQAAADLVSGAQSGRFEHGVYFCPLAPLRSAEGIVPAVAQALGFSFYEGSEPRQQLLDYLRQRSLLLVMDNFEHLLARPERHPERRPELVEGPSRRDGVGLVAEILRTAPHVKVLATSRASLKAQGEHLFHLGGMDFPDWEYPSDALEHSAVKLFLQSARRVRSNSNCRWTI
jgi:hypothetical protein